MKTNQKMKTRSQIKNLLATGLLACAFTTNVHATTPDDLISAQVNLARDMTQKMIRDLTDGGSDGIGESADFQAKAKDFAEKVDTAMKQFESAVKGKIFAEIALQVRQYNAIYRSNAYSPEQKTALLNQLFAQMTSSMKYSGQALDGEIIKLLNVAAWSEATGLILGNRVTWLASNMDHIIHLDLNDCNFKTKICSIPTRYGSYTNVNIYSATFEHLLIDGIKFSDYILYTRYISRISEKKDSCISSSCITLSSVMISKYLQLLQVNFSGKSVIQLADNKLVEIIPIGAATELSMVLDTLRSYSPPLDEMNRLPFSVTESEWMEYKRQQEERNRQQRLQILLSIIPKQLSEMNSCNDIIDSLMKDLREIQENQKTPLTDAQYQTILENSGDTGGFLGLGGHRQKKCLDQAIIQAK